MKRSWSASPSRRRAGDPRAYDCEKEGAHKHRLGTRGMGSTKTGNINNSEPSREEACSSHKPRLRRRADVDRSEGISTARKDDFPEEQSAR